MVNRRPRPQELTPAELEIMQILWDRESAFVNDILAELPEPKPAYNTVSTIVRILEQKGYLAHKAYGRSHEYYPIIDRESYTKDFMVNVLNNFSEALQVEWCRFSHPMSLFRWRRPTRF